MRHAPSLRSARGVSLGLGITAVQRLQSVARLRWLNLPAIIRHIRVTLSAFCLNCVNSRCSNTNDSNLMIRIRGASLVIIVATIISSGFIAGFGYWMSSGLKPEGLSVPNAVFWIAVGVASTCGFWLIPLALGNSTAAFIFRLIAVVLQLPIALVFVFFLPRLFSMLATGALPSMTTIFVACIASFGSAYLVYTLFSIENKCE